MKPLWIAVTLCALVVASLVASSVAVEIVDTIDVFGYWAVLFLIWPVGLYVVSRDALDF